MSNNDMTLAQPTEEDPATISESNTDQKQEEAVEQEIESPEQDEATNNEE